MQLFLRLLLSLCLFLFSGNNVLFARVQKDHRSAAQTDKDAGVHTGIGQLQYISDISFHSVPSADEDTDEIEIPDYEDDDEEVTTFKKCAELPQNFPLYFYPHVPACMQVCTYKHVSFTDNLAYSSSHRYIFFRVIRI